MAYYEPEGPGRESMLESAAMGAFQAGLERALAAATEVSGRE